MNLTIEELSTKTVMSLKSYAKKNNIELFEANTKLEILEILASWIPPQIKEEHVEQAGKKNDLTNKVALYSERNLHMDKLQKWNPKDPSRVMRIFVQLTDWQPGQFWEVGNYQYNHWKAGDIFTFDTCDVPHCTANAGHHPRVTFQITGIRTEKTDDFINSLR